MFKTISKIFTRELIGGLLLFSAAVLALLVANSPLKDVYGQLLSTSFGVTFGHRDLIKPLLLWINDGLMVIFFLIIALEVKRECLEGELSTPSQVALPAIGALGGMLVPALIYMFFNYDNPLYSHGWAIPTATDIAFVLGVLALLGPRVPPGLRMFLLSLAIFDDIGAILVIAFFYSHELSLVMLSGSLVCLAILFAFNRLGVRKLTPYMLVGLVMWLFVLKSGVHATLAGVALGLMIPHKNAGGAGSPLKQLEYALHPYVVYMILPLFAFTNAGVTLGNLTLDDFHNTVTYGVSLGLFFGKQFGIAAFVWVAVKLGFATLPRHTDWPTMYAGCILCGIGFTMSLFIASLSFVPGTMDNFAADRLGIFIGSIASGVVGYALITRCHQKRVNRAQDAAFVDEYSKH